MLTAKIQTNAEGYAKFTYPSPMSWTTNIMALATIQKAADVEGIWTVHAVNITQEFAEFQVSRSERAQGLIGAILSYFIKPSTDATCSINVMVEEVFN